MSLDKHMTRSSTHTIMRICDDLDPSDLPHPMMSFYDDDSPRSFYGDDSLHHMKIFYLDDSLDTAEMTSFVPSTFVPSTEQESKNTTGANFNEVCAALFDVRHEWFNLGLALGLPYGILQDIKRDHILRDCFTEMLREWLRFTNPTWSDLVKALRSPRINRPFFAAKIVKYITVQGLAGACAIRNIQESQIFITGQLQNCALGRSSTDKDEDEDRLLLLEKKGLKNARKMVPRLQKKDAEIKALVERFKNVKSQMGDLLVLVSDDQSIVVIVPKMSQNVIKELFSQPFFLEKYRYKLCLQVSMDGSGGSLSVFVHIMKGDFDSILDWPFMHKVAIKVKNQKGGEDGVHIVQPDSTCIKKPEVDQNITFGSRNFPTYSELVTGGFVRDDSISIECEVLWN